MYGTGAPARQLGAGHDGPGAGGGGRRGRAWPGDDCCPPAQDGKTPLHCASQWGHVEVAKALMEKGADVGAKDKVRMRRATTHVRESARQPSHRAGMAARRAVTRSLSRTRGSRRARTRTAERAQTAAGALRVRQSLWGAVLVRGA